MTDMQPQTADDRVGESLTEERRTELREALTQVRQDKALRAATLRASITQPVNATVWLNISAGVWKPGVFLGL